MIADMHVYELGDAILMTTIGDVKDALMARLDQFIFAEEVQLGDVTATYAQWGVVGPDAADAVAALVGGLSASALRALPEHGNTRSEWRGQPIIVTRTGDVGVPGFDLFVEAAAAGFVNDALLKQGVEPLDAGTAETLRIEGGIPAFHQDMDEETIPLEAGIESRAISFTKGCYVGQEVIIRVLHRGHGRVARKLVGLSFQGDHVPVAGSPVTADAREIGRVTSSAWSPMLLHPIAFAYVHRDFVPPGTRVTADDVGAEVVTLPFVPPDPPSSN
jgi:folate-binding protein YgfZ